MTEPLRRADLLLIFVVDLRVVAATDQSLDRVGIVGGASIYPLVWNTLLAARSAGFGGTLTTISVASEPQVKALLDIPTPFAIAAVVPLGKPVHQCTGIPVYRSTGITGNPVYRFTGIPVCRYTGIPVYRHTSMPV